MEGSGFFSDSSGGHGHSNHGGAHGHHHHDSGNWHWHDNRSNHSHHHHDHSSTAAPFIGGAIVGGIIGSIFSNNRRQGGVLVVPPYPNQPVPRGFPVPAPAPPPIIRPVPSYINRPQQTPAYGAIPVVARPVVDEVEVARRRIRRAICKMIVFLIAALVFAYVFVAFWVPKAGTDAYEVMPGDRKAISLDTTLLRDVQLSSSAGRTYGKAYLFYNTPELSDVVQYPLLQIRPDIKLGSYHYMRYDLYQGSTVDVSWTFSSFNVHPSFLVMKGEHHFKTFQQFGYAPYDSVVHEEKAPSGRYLFTAEERSEYYFIFYARDKYARATGTANFLARAVTLSLAKPLASCTLTPSSSNDACRFDLSSYPPRSLSLVLQADLFYITPADPLKAFVTRRVSYSLTAGIWGLVALGVLVVVVIAAVVWLSCLSLSLRDAWELAVHGRRRDGYVPVVPEGPPPPYTGN
ncbi:hypothetical protein HDU96_001816 [Phlyctochytrium bullatum]|nr:hypothetical protein HDU96_001816 [Phlyctochytrium bullatum]